jgi:hypothetical protein
MASRSSAAVPDDWSISSRRRRGRSDRFVCIFAGKVIDQLNMDFAGQQGSFVCDSYCRLPQVNASLSSTLFHLPLVETSDSQRFAASS